MSDAFTNAVTAFGTVNNAFQQQREFERQQGLDAERREGAIQERKLRGLQIDSAEHDLRQKRLLDDVNYTQARIRELADAYQTDEDTYNGHVDKLWNDPVFQRTYKAVPELERALDRSSQLAQTYHEFGQTLADVATNHESNPDFKDDGKGHQELTGQTADKLFGLLDQMEDGNRWPKTVIPGSVKFVSMNGRGDWGVAFKYTNDAGKVVDGVATKNRTRNGEPGSEQDPLVLKSIPELFQETQSKLTTNLALAGLRARAQAGEPQARTTLDKMDADQVQQAINSEDARGLGAALEEGMAAWDDKKTDAQNYAAIKSKLLKSGKKVELVNKAIDDLMKIKEPKDPALQWRDNVNGNPITGAKGVFQVAYDRQGKPVQAIPQYVKPDKDKGEGKEKNPVLYTIEKTDGRIIQVDASTPKGRARLQSALDGGYERVSKLGTESESTTTINLQTGDSTTRRVSGPTAQPQAVAVAPPAKKRPPIDSFWKGK